MKQAMQKTNAGFRQGEFPAIADFALTSTLERLRPHISNSAGMAANGEKALAKACAALVDAYLDVNLNARSIPLKEFMDDLEKNILLACLSLTQGSQRNAATLLGLKPTALFEKMRKHSINGRRIRLSEKLLSAPPREIA